MHRSWIVSIFGSVVLGGLLTMPAAAQTPYAGTPVVAELQARRADVWAGDRIPYYYNYFSLHYFDTPVHARDDGFGMWGANYGGFYYPRHYATVPAPATGGVLRAPANLLAPPRYHSPGDYSPGIRR
jgi:hypothetical protein